jgi:hypothetical protein
MKFLTIFGTRQEMNRILVDIRQPNAVRSGVGMLLKGRSNTNIVIIIVILEVTLLILNIMLLRDRSNTNIIIVEIQNIIIAEGQK